VAVRLKSDAWAASMKICVAAVADHDASGLLSGATELLETHLTVFAAFTIGISTLTERHLHSKRLHKHISTTLSL